MDSFTAAELAIVGMRIPRIDNTSKLTGRARFVEDLRLSEPMLFGAILRSPHPHARIASMDTSAAEAQPGVRGLITAADFPDRRVGKCLVDERALARNRVRFVGDRVAAVAAESLEQAQQACSHIQVCYEPLPAVMSPAEALAPGAPLLHPQLMDYEVIQAAQPVGGNVCSENTLSRGDPDTAFDGCAQLFHETYTTEMVHHAYLEPHACIGVYNPDGNYTVYSATQGTFGLRGLIADALGIAHNRVRLVPTEIGGGFGGKISLQDEAVAAALARKAGQPVRIVMTRAEDFITGTPRAGFRIELKTGVDRDANLVARTIDITLDGGAYAHGGVLMCWSLPQFAEGPYHIPNLRVTARCVYTNKPPSSSFRAPGGPQINFAIESEMERIAEAMGWDALAFRRQNGMREGHISLAGVTMRGVMTEETMQAGLALSGYRPPGYRPGKPGSVPPPALSSPELGRLEPSSPDPSSPELSSPRPTSLVSTLGAPICTGRGFALGNWNVGGYGSGAVLKLNEDGSASLLTGVVDLTGVHTALAQIIAEVLALPMEQVTVATLDTESAPHSTISAGSNALKSMGDAALRAALDVRSQLFQLAIAELDTQPERMELAQGEVRVRTEPGDRIASGNRSGPGGPGGPGDLGSSDASGDRSGPGSPGGPGESGQPQRAVPVTRLLARALGDSGPVIGQGTTGAYTRTPGMGVHVADVEVDPETGELRLVRYCAAQDVGRAINPVAVEGQIHGAVVQGVGMAVSEELIFRDNRVANLGFLDYKIPSALDVPRIETVLVEQAAADGPFGAKGIGEPPIVPVPAALANAVYDAVGVRLTSLPITPEKLRRAIRKRQQAAARS